MKAKNRNLGSARDRKTFPKTARNGQVRKASAAKIVPFRGSKQTSPTPRNGNVPPRRMPNSAVRTREYLTPCEVDDVMKAAGSIGRHRHRDSTLILVAYRHGFRVSEIPALRWDQVDLDQGLLHVSRLKNGMPSVQPIRGPEVRALRRLRRQNPDSPYVFVTERGGPLTASTVQSLSRAPDRLPDWHSRFILTCFAMPPATSSRTRGTTLGRFSNT